MSSAEDIHAVQAGLLLADGTVSALTVHGLRLRRDDEQGTIGLAYEFDGRRIGMTPDDVDRLALILTSYAAARRTLEGL